MLLGSVTVRHILLTVAALAVFGLGIYLFLEVRATPATADVPRRADKPVRDDAPEALPPKEALPSEVSIPKRGAEPRTPKAWKTPATRPDEVKPNGTEVLKVDQLMSEASKAYDKGDFDEAKMFASKVLTQDASNVRMLRIMVSASCIDGASIEAQKYYLLLPAPDREQMKIRCDRYGIAFNEK
jgi:hypothetical protein